MLILEQLPHLTVLLLLVKVGDTCMDIITVVGVQDLDFVSEFVKFTRGCDQLLIKVREIGIENQRILEHLFYFQDE